MFGFYDRILIIDVTNETFEIRPLPEQPLAECLGGKGLATRLLLEMNPPGVDPLGPDNRLIFATGPFCGTRLWGGSRYGVFTKSPLTGLYCESYSGGKMPEALDAAGFDAVVIHGQATRPLALSVHPEGCAFHDASDLWGADNFTAEDEALKRYATPGAFPKRGAAVIGPAAENLVRFAIISNDYWRCAGRAGAGTVMGSKRIKAVVFQGDRKRRMANPEGVAAFAKAFAAAGKDNPGVKAYKAFGTTMMVAIMNTAGAFPARYWSQGTCDHWERLSGETFHKEHDVAPHACLKCFMACGRMATLTKGRHKGLKLEGPEYETIYAFGGLCMIEEMEEVVYLNDLCDRLGMDTITAGNLCAFAIEAVRRGRLDYPIDYGDADAVAGLVEKIARREGLGAILADGIVPAARRFGLEELAVHVKGLEPAGYDPRVLKGMGLAYATSDRGACHLRTTFYKPELARMIPADAIEGKASMLIDFEDRLTLFDCLILCRFYRDMYTWEKLSESIGLVTGLPSDKASLQAVAGHVADMTRRFNLREGMTAEADRLPSLLLKTPLPSGHALSEEEMAFMLADYYRLRGWDSSGAPASEQLP